MSKRRRIPNTKYAGSDWELDAADVEGGGEGGGEGAAAEPAGGAPLAGVSAPPAGDNAADAGAGEGNEEPGGLDGDEEGGSEGGGEGGSEDGSEDGSDGGGNGGEYESGGEVEEEEEEAPAAPPAKRARAPAAAPKPRPKPRPKPAPRGQLEASTPAARREHLVAALKARGLALRSDSRLCAQYIRSGGDLIDVVDTMAEMKFYHSHTSYSSEYDRLMDEAENDGEELTYYNDYGERRREFVRRWYDKDEISFGAKHAALKKWVENRGGPEYAVARPELPPSLAQTILQYARSWGMWR